MHRQCVSKNNASFIAQKLLVIYQRVGPFVLGPAKMGVKKVDTDRKPEGKVLRIIPLVYAQNLIERMRENTSN